MTVKRTHADEGYEIELSGRIVRFYPLNWAAMKRTREQRAMVFQGKGDKSAPEYDDAVFEILFESISSHGEVMSRDEFALLLNQGNFGHCFRAMAKATRIESEEVADDGDERPTKNLNGTGSTLTLSTAPDGTGTTATN